MYGEFPPTCCYCGERIRLFDGLWREHVSGTVRASYAVDLDTLRTAGRRLWHVGCYDPMAHPAPRLDRTPRGMPFEYVLAGAVI